MAFYFIGCLAKNVKFGLYSAKIRQIQFSVTLMSLKRHFDVYWYFLVLMERGDLYLSSGTKIIGKGGFIAKILEGGGNHPPLVDVF